MEKGTRERQSDDGLGQSGTSTTEEALKYKFDSLSFAVQKSRRYHEMLSSFYSVWRDRMKIITAAAGSGAFLIVTAKHQHAAEIVSAFIALWATLDIIISPDKKADRSRDLCERFTELASRIEEAACTEAEYRRLAAARLTIERGEMPVKRLVDLQARNDECRVRGYPPDEQVPLSKWQRRLGYYFTFGMPRLEEWKANRQRSGSSSPA
jgi:hypothetical protein